MVPVINTFVIDGNYENKNSYQSKKARSIIKKSKDVCYNSSLKMEQEGCQ